MMQGDGCDALEGGGGGCHALGGRGNLREASVPAEISRPSSEGDHAKH